MLFLTKRCFFGGCNRRLRDFQPLSLAKRPILFYNGDRIHEFLTKSAALLMATYYIVSGKRGQEMKLNEKLFQCRKRCGLSQEELAERLGVSRQAVSKW